MAKKGRQQKIIGFQFIVQGTSPCYFIRHCQVTCLARVSLCLIQNGGTPKTNKMAATLYNMTLKLSMLTYLYLTNLEIALCLEQFESNSGNIVQRKMYKK